MKKILCLLLAVVMMTGLGACGGSASRSEDADASGDPSETSGDNSGSSGNPSDASGDPSETSGDNSEASVDYSGYTIRIYSNSNSDGRAQWLTEKARNAGFSVSIDDESVISGDAEAVEAANKNKDGDILFGLNETRWGQIADGAYENLSLADWTPSWSGEVGEYIYSGQAYGLVIQNVLMLYRNDMLGTNGTALHFKHWSDIVDCGYSWYRQGKVGGTTNANINNSILYPYVDPQSPAGGISVEGWKTLWKYCAGGKYTGDAYGFDPLNRGDVQVSTFYASALYGSIASAAETSENPLRGTQEPENWSLVEIDDGTYYIAEYLGILNRAGRTREETETVKAFAEWFGSAQIQAAWAEEFDTFPCNQAAAKLLYSEEIPAIYTLKNLALTTVEGTDMTYAQYVARHSAQWTNIMTNLGFYWTDDGSAPAEPDWDDLDWGALTQGTGQIF